MQFRPGFRGCGSVQDSMLRKKMRNRKIQIDRRDTPNHHRFRQIDLFPVLELELADIYHGILL